MFFYRFSLLTKILLLFNNKKLKVRKSLGNNTQQTYFEIYSI